MITGRLVGDDTMLAWLRATPDAAASGLARAIAQLGIDLQRKIQETELADRMLSARSKSFERNVGLQIDESSDRIAATVSGDDEDASARGKHSDRKVDPSASLRHKRKAFRLAIAERRIDMRSYPRRIELPERAFLRSALEDMEPEIRSNLEEALREVLTR
jgi:hypothetical protein